MIFKSLPGTHAVAVLTACLLATTAAAQDLPGPLTPPPLPTDTPKKPDRPYVFGDKTPDFTLTSAEFAGEFLKGAAAHKARYAGKLIEVTGRIEIAERTLNGEGQLVISGGEKIAPRVTCATKDAEPWNKAMPGQTVTLRGVNSRGGTVTLSDCEIVKVNGDEPALITAREFQGTAEKSRQSYLRLVGRVEKVSVTESGSSEVVFVADGGPKVYARFNPIEVGTVRALKPKQKITVLGKNLAGTPEAVGLVWCVILQSAELDG